MYNFVEILAFLLIILFVEYEKQEHVGQHIIDCSNGRPTDDPTKVCRWELDLVPRSGCVYRIEYGYEDGTPCIILKLNRIYGWKPDPLDSLVEKIGSNSTAGVEVECRGVSDADQENIGHVDYQPFNYFPRYYFPFLGQEGYRDPLIFAMFQSPVKNVIILIECVAKAKNLNYEGPNRESIVRFEILID